MGGGWFNMHMELPSKLKDANVNEIMTTMMMGTYLRWICRLGPMQLKWAEDAMSCQALSLSINCCPSTVAQPAGRIMSSVGGCVCLHICIHTSAMMFCISHISVAKLSVNRKLGQNSAACRSTAKLTCLSTAADTVSRFPFTKNQNPKRKNIVHIIMRRPLIIQILFFLATQLTQLYFPSLDFAPCLFSFFLRWVHE